MPFVTEEELDPLPSEKSVGSVATGGALNLLNAITLGGGDELTSGVGALLERLYATPARKFLPLPLQALGAAASTSAPADRSLAESYSARMGTSKELIGQFREQAGGAKHVIDLGGALLMPLKTFVKATDTFIPTAAKLVGEGAAIGGTAGFLSGDEGKRIDSAKLGALLGGIITPAVGAPLQALGRIFANAPAEAEKLYMASAGAKPGDFTASARRGGLSKVESMEDVAETKLKEAFIKLKGKNIIEGSKNPTEIYNKSVLFANKLEDEVGGILDLADNQLQGMKVYPKFTNAEKYIQSAEVGETKALRAELLERKGAFREHPESGTLRFLQDQKIKLYGKAYPIGGKSIEGLDKAIARDYKEAIEHVTDAVLPKEASGTVKKLNQELAPIYETRPIFRRAKAEEEGKTILQKITDFIKTTGGYGSLMTAGGLSVGTAGVVAGAIAGKALNKVTNTPSGKALASKVIAKLPVKAGVPLMEAGKRSRAVVAESLADKGDVEEERTPIEIEISPIQGGRFVTEDELDPLPQGEDTPLAAPEILSARTGKEVPPKEDIDLDTLGKVPEAIVKKVVWAESKGKNEAVSPKGATGKFQLMPATFNEWAPRIGIKNPNIKNPEHNEKVGRAYLNYLSERYGGNPALYLAAYNWGMGRVDKLLSKVGPDATAADLKPYLPAETKGYLKQILA